jgi:hypothetical protein
MKLIDYIQEHYNGNVSAFGIDDMEKIVVKSESWGVMVEILSGDHAGVYDYHANNNSFIAA